MLLIDRESLQQSPVLRSHQSSAYPFRLPPSPAVDGAQKPEQVEVVDQDVHGQHERDDHHDDDHGISETFSLLGHG